MHKSKVNSFSKGKSMKVHLGVQKSSSLKPTKLNTKSNDEGPCFSQKGDNKGGNNVILFSF